MRFEILTDTLDGKQTNLSTHNRITCVTKILHYFFGSSNAQRPGARPPGLLSGPSCEAARFLVGEGVLITKFASCPGRVEI